MKLKVETEIGEVVPAWVSGVVDELEECVNLIVEKTGGYGLAWKSQGWMGNLARIMSKTSRLRNLLWSQEAQEGSTLVRTNESVDDTLRDLINLAVFMRLNREAGNKWGLIEGISENVSATPPPPPQSPSWSLPPLRNAVVNIVSEERLSDLRFGPARERSDGS